MSLLGKAARNLFEYFTCEVCFGVCGFMVDAAEKLEGWAAGWEFDGAVMETIPRAYAEKRRRGKMPSEGACGFSAREDAGFSENQIGLHRVLDGFDEEAIRSARQKVLVACSFIVANAGCEPERDVALRLAKMLRAGRLMITDTELAGEKHVRGYFCPGGGLAYIGLDIATLLDGDAACAVDILAHEAYHAWRYYTSSREYSIIEEARAWNTGLRFSNRYREMHGIPILRERDYTEDELMEKSGDYLRRSNVKLRFGPGENIIERAGYGIANLIEDAADVVNGWTDKIWEKTFRG
jgi:hypothetical protein